MNKKKLTIYCIRYGRSSKKAFIAIADNSIPLKIIKCYADVDNSLIYEEYVEVNKISLMKKIIMDDTGKNAILYRNHTDKLIREFIDKVIGYEVNWIEYSFNIWTKAFNGLQKYSLKNKSIIEIDHPINLKDEMLIAIIKNKV